MTSFANTAKGDPWVRRAGANAAGYPAYTVWENIFDAAELNLGIGDDVDPIITIPANTLIQGVFVEILTIEAATLIDVGDTADPNGYVAAQSGAVAGMFQGVGAYIAADTDVTAQQIPQMVTVDTDLQILVAGAASTVLKFRVIVVGVNLG